jgi:biotin carboxyl carrier protein
MRLGSVPGDDHRSAALGADKRLDRWTDRLFPPKALLGNDGNKQTTMTEIKVPTVAGSSKLSIGRWFKREGDPVTFQEPLVEIDTNNVTREIQAPATGILSRILARDGATVEPGTVVGMIDQI